MSMIPLIKSTFYNERETKRLLCAFIKRAEHLSMGRECEKFERSFARWQGRKHCVFVNSGSSANLALIQALLNLGMLKKGASVGFSTLTWSTNAMPLIQLGLTPIPVDISLDTLNVSSKTLSDVLKKHKLSCLFLTNLLGFCDDIDEIVRVCKKHKVILIEDNCESLGTVYKGKKLGNFGLASTFSFYVGHHMSTIEGGAVCTDSHNLASMLQVVRAHGWDRNLSQRRQMRMREKYQVNSTFYSRYTFYDLGYNFRATEINGFIGNVQLTYLDEIIKKRIEHFHALSEPIYAKEEYYYPIKHSHIDVLSNFAVPVICRTKKIRDILVEKCKNKVEIRPVVGGDMTKQPFFGKYIKTDFPLSSNSKIVHEQGLYFGNNPELTRKEITSIINLFTRL